MASHAHTFASSLPSTLGKGIHLWRDGSRQQEDEARDRHQAQRRSVSVIYLPCGSVETWPSLRAERWLCRRPSVDEHPQCASVTDSSRFYRRTGAEKRAGGGEVGNPVTADARARAVGQATGARGRIQAAKIVSL